VKAAEETPLAPLPPEIEGYTDDERPEVQGRWEIASPGDADWALSVVAESDAEVAEIERQALAAIARVEARRDALTAKAARRGNFFRFKLAAYAQAHRAAILGTGRRKSRDYVHGRISWRAKPERLVVEDAAALEAWLVAQPVERGLYRMKVEPEMRAIQALYAEHGECPPGCGIKVEPETISITANAPETALAKEE